MGRAPASWRGPPNPSLRLCKLLHHSPLLGTRAPHRLCPVLPGHLPQARTPGKSSVIGIPDLNRKSQDRKSYSPGGTRDPGKDKDSESTYLSVCPPIWQSISKQARLSAGAGDTGHGAGSQSEEAVGSGPESVLGQDLPVTRALFATSCNAFLRPSRLTF